MTHGHELRGWDYWKEGGKVDTGWRGAKGKKNLYNCNIIINKIYFKKIKSKCKKRIKLKQRRKVSSIIEAEQGRAAE